MDRRDQPSMKLIWKIGSLFATGTQVGRQWLYAIAFGFVLWSGEAAAQGVPASCPNDLATADIINHDFAVSFCELCDIGTVRIEIENPLTAAIGAP